ncbi:hypothetical protein NVP1232O_36 [Vibrio phage 1.232.O._10N.261.51.E11]|nr:hypothetical protein NVP1232O_36 [Vibrio phage 1.232.O._10N.261.51.E11]
MSEVMCIHCPAVVKETDTTCAACGGQQKEQGQLMNKYIGRIYPTNNCGKLEITKYINTKNVEVEFLTTGYKTTSQMINIKNGCVKDPLCRSVFGIGFVGVGEFNVSVNREQTKAYRCWYGMFRRCYSKKYQEQKPTYIGCAVHPDWHNFQTFAKWYHGNYPTGDQDYELDKDILVDGNKVYSPNTCMFVTSEDNTIKAHAKSYAFLSPDGVFTEVYNLRKFCMDNSLHDGCMCKVHLGKAKQHKGWTKSNLTSKVRADVLRWLVAQHDLDFHKCPTEIMTHSYVMKLADSLDVKAGKVK